MNMQVKDLGVRQAECAAFRAFCSDSGFPQTWVSLTSPISGTLSPPRAPTPMLIILDSTRPGTRRGSIHSVHTQRSPSFSTASLIGPASVPRGVTANGNKIMAWRTQLKTKQCIIKVGPPENLRYRLVRAAECGGDAVITAAIETGDIP